MKLDSDYERVLNSVYMAGCVHELHYRCAEKCAQTRLMDLNVLPDSNELSRAISNMDAYNRTDFEDLFYRLQGIDQLRVRLHTTETP